MNHAQRRLADLIGSFGFAFRWRGSAVLGAGLPKVGIGSPGMSLAFVPTIRTSANAAHSHVPGGPASVEFPPVEGASG